MQTFDEKKLEALLNDNKQAEARAYLESFLNAPKMVQEQTDAAIDYAHIYMKIMNRINARHLAALREAQAILKKVASTENQVEEKLKVAKLKAELKV